MLWSLLPNLHHLHWIIPTCGVLLANHTRAFGLPPNLKDLHLAIHLDFGTLEGIYDLDLLDLTPFGYEYHEKLSSLCIIPAPDPTSFRCPTDVHLGPGDSDIDFPKLDKLHMTAIKLTGRLQAPNLTSIRLEIEESLDWKSFNECRLLSAIWVTCLNPDSVFDCTGCTSPPFLRLLHLKVVVLKDDGFLDPCSHLLSLGLMRLEFRALGSTVCLRSSAKDQLKDIVVSADGIIRICSSSSGDMDVAKQAKFIDNLR